MKRILLILSLSLFSLYGCTQNNSSEARKEFHAISTIDSLTQPVQQEFIDTLTSDMHKIQQDNAANIDTKELSVLMDSAKLANLSQIELLRKVKQVDNEIALRDNVLSFVIFTDTAYTSIGEAVKIFSSNSSNKFDDIMQELSPIFEKLQQGYNKMDIIKNQMKKNTT